MSERVGEHHEPRRPLVASERGPSGAAPRAPGADDVSWTEWADAEGAAIRAAGRWREPRFAVRGKVT